MLMRPDAFGAAQLALLPPLLPVQFQFQGPLPVTAEAVPAEQKLAVGAAMELKPLELPHVPLTGAETEAKLAVMFWLAVTLLTDSGLAVLVGALGPVPMVHLLNR